MTKKEMIMQIVKEYVKNLDCSLYDKIDLQYKLYGKINRGCYKEGVVIQYKNFKSGLVNINDIIKSLTFGEYGWR